MLSNFSQYYFINIIKCCLIIGIIFQITKMNYIFAQEKKVKGKIVVVAGDIARINIGRNEDVEEGMKFQIKRKDVIIGTGEAIEISGTSTEIRITSVVKNTEVDVWDIVENIVKKVEEVSNRSMEIEIKQEEKIIQEKPIVLTKEDETIKPKEENYVVEKVEKAKPLEIKEEEEQIEKEDKQKKSITLKVENPLSDIETKQDKIVVSGTTESDASLPINKVSANQGLFGKFKTEIPSNKGDSTTTIATKSSAGNTLGKIKCRNYNTMYHLSIDPEKRWGVELGITRMYKNTIVGTISLGTIELGDGDSIPQHFDYPCPHGDYRNKYYKDYTYGTYGTFGIGVIIFKKIMIEVFKGKGRYFERTQVIGISNATGWKYNHGGTENKVYYTHDGYKIGIVTKNGVLFFINILNIPEREETRIGFGIGIASKYNIKR